MVLGEVFGRLDYLFRSAKRRAKRRVGMYCGVEQQGFADKFILGLDEETARKSEEKAECHSLGAGHRRTRLQ